MPRIEYGINTKGLAQFSEFHVAERAKRYDVERLLERCEGYEIVEPTPPFEHPAEDFTEYYNDELIKNFINR